MSRHSERNEEYLRVQQHEADRNISGLIADLSSEQALIREHVATALARLGANEAAPHIANLADDPVKTVRMSAYMALGELRAKDSVDALLQGLKDPVPVVRMGAANGLENFSDTSAIPGLREALASEADREVRFCIARALVKLRDTQVLKDLPKVVRETPWRIHFSSEWKELKRAAESQELPPTY